MDKYSFTRYDTPIFGIFSVDSGKWDPIKNKWKTPLEECKIIGKSDLHYITREIDAVHIVEVKDSVEYKTEKIPFKLPIGYHKSRLVSWK